MDFRKASAEIITDAVVAARSKVMPLNKADREGQPAAPFSQLPGVKYLPPSAAWRYLIARPELAE